MKLLESDGRRATPEEQKTLARYVGWGGMKGAFDPDNKQWSKEYAELRELLDEGEYAAARRSILDAHYTSTTIIEAIYDGLRRLGFTGGRVLEPSVGVGHFFGLMPADMRANSALSGVELDKITGLIVKHLYPKARIAAPKGFQEVAIEPGSFDLAVGNPPFGSQRLFDAAHPDLSKFSIHNFFFAKSLLALRDGGIQAMVVSRYFMDAQDVAARTWIAERAKFLGAVRLPYTAFKGNANTEVVTDIVFLQKGGRSNGGEWIDTAPLALQNKDGAPVEVQINRYFLDHPDQVLGTASLAGSMYRSDEYTVQPAADAKSLPAELRRALERVLPEGSYQPGAWAAEDMADVQVLVPEGVKVGAYYLGEDGTIMQRVSDRSGTPHAEAVALESKAAGQRIRGLIGVREALRALMRAELSAQASKLELTLLREKLNQVYDRFVKTHGYINRLGNRRAFAQDPDLPLLEALEAKYDPGVTAAKSEKTGIPQREPSAQKADIFSKRVLAPFTHVTKADSAKDALVASLNERGCVDLAHMAALYGKPEEQITAELAGLIYRDPDAGWMPADEYLSGNVKHKLARARAMAEQDAAYAENVKALEAVQPEDVPPTKIAVRLGSHWIPASDIEQFARDLYEDPNPRAFYSSSVGRWRFKSGGGNDMARKSQWGTARMSAPDIVDALLNNRAIVIKDNVGTSREPVWVVNEAQTEAARAKADEVAQKFRDWIWSDQARRERLARHYNDTMNTDRKRTYDGSHLSLPGKNPGITLLAHQLNAVWRGITERVLLLDHVVGAGKTFEKIAIAMEMRRLGILRKPTFVVPNYLVRQWRDEFYRLYPGANVLAATESDFAKDNRRRLFGRIATGDWDAVIIGESSLKKIDMPGETAQRVVGEMMGEITSEIESLKRERGDRNILRDMERIKENLQAKIDRIQAKAGGKDDVVTFDELGIDGLFLDEAHLFKNLFFTSQMQNVAGLGSPSGSGKAFDLFVKTRYLTERYGEKAVRVFATGTPVSNSLVEMYTMQRYMMYDELKRRGLHLLDAWAGTFGDVKQVYEVHPSGSGYRLATRFAKFVNLAELMALYRRFADTITLDDLKAQEAAQGKRFPVPAMAGGKPRNIVAQRSDQQTRFFGVAEFARTPEGGIRFKYPPDLVPVEKEGKWYAESPSNQNARYGRGVESREEAVQEIEAMVRQPEVGYNNGSILWKFENLRQLTKETKGKINALSITNEARKDGLDYRLIDPAAPDFPGSKINLAVAEVKRIYDAWSADRGTQLIFSDLSTPLSERARAAAQERDVFVRDDKGDLVQVKGTIHKVAGFDDWIVYAVRQKKTKQTVLYDMLTGTRLLSIDLPRDKAIEVLVSRVKANPVVLDRLRGDSKLITDEEIDDWKNAQDNEEDSTEDEADDAMSLADLHAQFSGKSGFSVYDDVQAKLIAAGIPENEIAFIHDFDTAAKKADLFRRVNAGEIRVLMGSTPKMGAGMNVQERLVALHHLDAPWRPSDLEQREGRIIRRGNTLYERDPNGFQVEVLRYATDRTYDTRMWQIIEHKATGVEQLRKSDGTEREIEDVGGEAANASEMKAAASGNPLIEEEVKLRDTVRRLDALQAAYRSRRYDLESERRAWAAAPERLTRAKSALALAERTVATLEEVRDQNTGETWSITLGDTKHEGDEGKKAAAKALNAAITNVVKGELGVKVPIGEYRGFLIEAWRTKPDLIVRLRSDAKTVREDYYNLEKDNFSASGLIGRFDNALSDLRGDVRYSQGIVEDRQSEADAAPWKIADIDKELAKPFDREEQLQEARKHHGEIARQLAKAGGAIELSPEMRAELEQAIAERQVRFFRAKATPATAVEQSALDGLVRQVRQAWRNAPGIRVIDSIDDAPVAVQAEYQQQTEAGAQGEAEGFWHQGEIWLIRKGLSDMRRAAIVLAHEGIGHHGLRGFFGKELDNVLRRVALARRAQVRAKASAYGLNFDNETDRLTAAEEVLAEMAQEQPELGFVRQAIAAVKAWLRKVGVLRTDRISDAEIIREFLLPARQFVEGERQGRAPVGREQPAFGKRDVTQTPEFKRWFAGSKVVDAQGEPLVVYHGTGADVEQFSPERSGASTGAKDRGAPIWFAAQPGPAGTFAGLAKVAGGREKADALGREIDALYVQFHEARGTAQERSATQERILQRIHELQAQKKGLEDRDTPGGQNVIPAYLSARKLLDADQVEEYRYWRAEWDRRFPGEASVLTPRAKDEALKAALDGGYDGVVFRGVRDGGEATDIYAVFRPEQIKSVFNAGTFGPTNPDIRFSRPVRAQGIPTEASDPVFDATSAEYLKAHSDYRAAKAGDVPAAMRLVGDLVKPESLRAAAERFGPGAIYVAPTAVEASGINAIPAALAQYYASATGGTTDEQIVQANRVHHTGAGPMERLIARALFDGPVQAGARYVLVDDVTTMGSTLAELADHIGAGGGQVVGVVTLVNAGRSATLRAAKPIINLLERRFGDAIRSIFHAHPSALTGNEALYLAGFRDAQSLGDRAAKADQEAADRRRARAAAEEKRGLDDSARFSRAATQPATRPAGAGRRGLLDTILRRAGGEFVGQRITGPAYDKLLGWLNEITPERVKAGIVSDYGMPQSVLDRRAQLYTAIQRGYRDTQSYVDQLAALNRAESRVAYQWMTTRDPEEEARLMADLPEESRATLAELKERVTAMGREAVDLGILSRESFERNENAYLHRTYYKYETQESTPSERAKRARAVRILGEQFKGRGLFEATPMDKIRWPDDALGITRRGRQVDRELLGKRFVRYSQHQRMDDRTMTLEGFEPGASQGRLLRVEYWPADHPAPARYQEWQNDGTFEVRGFPNGETLTMWRDFTPEELTRMGEIQEVKYATARTMMMMTHDLEVARYFDWLASTPEYSRLLPSPDMRITEASENLGRAYAPDEWVQVPETKIPGTQVPRYGKLAGRYVQGAIWNDIRQVNRLNSRPLGDTYDAFMRFWKVNKTARSPVVHANNVFANFMMADWHDVGARDVLAALRVLARPDDEQHKAMIRRFEDAGATHGMFVQSELKKEITEPLLEQLRREIDEADEATGLVQAANVVSLLFHGRIREAWAAASHSKAMTALQRVDQRIVKAYEQEDALFRLAAFMRALENGATDEEAGTIARKAFLDYHITAPWIAAARSTVLPFIGFPYRAIPMLLETIARKPWKIAKVAMVAGLLNSIAYAMLGLDADDEERERRYMPPEKAGRIWGLVPKLVRMPWNDEHGSPVFLDIRRWVVVGDVLDVDQGHSAIPLLPAITPGGPLAVLGELVLNRSQFTGRGIAQDTDTAGEQAEKVATHLYRSIAPNAPWVPWSYSASGLVQAGTGVTDVFGREMSVPQAALSAAGVKLASYPGDVLQYNEARRIGALQGELNARERAAARQAARGAITVEKMQEISADLAARRVKLAEEFAGR